MKLSPSSVSFSACLAAGLLQFASPARAQGFSFNVTDLSTLGGVTSQAYGINNSAEIVGASDTPDDGPQHAFYRGAGGGALIDLGTLAGGTTSTATGINASGQVTGFSTFFDGTIAGTHAFLTGPHGTGLTDLGALPGGRNSAGYGVNAAGRVAGQSQISTGATHAFLSAPGGGALADLGTLGGTNSFGRAVNASNQVAGYSNTPSGNLHAFLSDPTQNNALRDLGTLNGGATSFGLAVNSSGRVVGRAAVSAPRVHAVISGPNGGALTDLLTLGGRSSQADAINDANQVVGYSFLSDNSTRHAFIVLTLGGAMIDLNSLIDPSLGWVLTEAEGINANGQIVGYGLLNNQLHAFLLDPVAVPEPATWILTASGLLALVISRRVRSRSSWAALG